MWVQPCGIKVSDSLFLPFLSCPHPCMLSTFGGFQAFWVYLFYLFLIHIAFPLPHSSVEMCCTARLFLGRHNTHMYSPQLRSAWQDHTDTPTVLPGETLSFIGTTYRSMVEGFLGAEKTRRQLHNQGPPQRGDSSWKLETCSHCTAHRQLNHWESALVPLCPLPVTLV